MNNDWISLIFDSDYGATLCGPETLLLTLLLSAIVGQFIAWVYMRTHRGLSYSQSFVASLVVIPALVAVMMVLMAGSIVVAFGLIAVFAVVRFRNVLKDTRDTAFVLWTITEGLGIGTLRYSTALVAGLAIGALLVYLWVTDFGSRSRYNALLNLHLSGEQAGEAAALRSVLRRHSSRVCLAGERHLAGDGVDVSYRLLLRDPMRDDELRSELEGLPGLEQINLFSKMEESEI